MFVKGEPNIKANLNLRVHHGMSFTHLATWKVRHESAGRGKLHDEVSAPTTTQDETKTDELRNPLPQTTLRPIFMSKDFSYWMMNREYYLKYSQTYGPFDLDGASDYDGLKSQVAEDSCCPARPF
jgi:hypothetical protein